MKKNNIKRLLASLLLLSTYASQAQIAHNPGKNPPDVYIDSVRFAGMPYFDLDKIVDIRVAKDQRGSRNNGVIYITAKAPRSFSFLSLEQVAQQHTKGSTPAMVMVDNQFITDMTGMAIDSSYILRCETLSTKDFKYLQLLPSMNIVNIITASKENVEKSKKIMIRG